MAVLDLGKVVPEKGTDYFTESDVEQIVREVSETIDIPEKTSDLTNDSGFIDNTVNDLVNYTTTGNMNTAISNAVGTETTNRQASDANLQNQIDAITASSDVVDVLGTYQDLQNYDTTGLTDKDVVKVLQDSTHNNALSYYRWVITSNVGAWNYIGSEGPFYTKGEADALLNTKQNTIDSTHKLDADLIDDEESTKKLTTIAEKAFWSDKQETIQYRYMPTNLSSENEGQIVQYIGESDSTYINGYFYICVENSGTYSWEELQVQAGGGDSDITKIYWLTGDYTNTSGGNIASQSLTADDVATVNKFVDSYRAGEKCLIIAKKMRFYTERSRAEVCLNIVGVVDDVLGKLYIMFSPSENNLGYGSASIKTQRVNRNINFYPTTPSALTSLTLSGLINPPLDNEVMFLGNTISYTPTGDYNPSTKKYVDDSISNAIGSINTVLASLTTPSNGGGN